MIRNSIEVMESNYKELFQNPPNEYRIFPIMHNLCDPKEEANMTKRLQQNIDSGAGGLVTNTTWADKEWVFNKHNLERLEKAARMAKAKGMNVWMYDDYYYPSGWANGYAIKDHPEYACRNISYVLQQGQGKSDIFLEKAADNTGFLYAAFYPVADGMPDFTAPIVAEINNDEINTISPKGEWLLLVFYIKKHNATEEEKAHTAKHPGGYREYLNFLSKAAVDEFIEQALQPVAVHFGEDFGTLFDAVFTDEPTVGGPYLCFPRGKVDFRDIPAPWGPTLFEAFQAQWGYDLTKNLPALFMDNSLSAKRVRLHYYRTISDIALEAFTKNVAEWCKAHNTSASGHFLLEEGLLYHVGYYGDYMKLMSGQDYPGCDVLAADAQKFWEKRSGFDTSWLFAAKYPSSAARIKGHNITMMEICPVNYTDKFHKDPFKEFMGLTTSTIFTGITHYNCYGYGYIKEEAQHRALNEYTGRLLMLLRNSVSDCRIGVYYPIATAQSLFAGNALQPEPAVDLLDEAHDLENQMEQLANDLYEAKLDFNIFTEGAILNAQIEQNTLKIAQMQVNALLVPFNDFLPLAVVKKLLEAAQSGVQVWFVEGLPQHGLNEWEDEQIKALYPELLGCCPAVTLAEFPERADELHTVAEELMKVQGEGIFCSRYRFMGKVLYYIINTKEQNQTVNIDGPFNSITLLNPIDGSMSEIKAPASIEVQGERGIILLAD